MPPGLGDRPSISLILCWRGSGRLALRTCTVRPSRRCKVTVTRCCVGNRLAQRLPALVVAFGLELQAQRVHEVVGQHADEQVALHFDFAQRDGVGGVGVLLGRHPLGTRRRLRPAHDVVSRAQRLSSLGKSVIRDPFCSNSTSTPLAISAAIRK